MNGVTIITLNRSPYSCLRSYLVDTGVSCLCTLLIAPCLPYIYYCTNPIVMIILACLHNCITPHLHAWARRLRRHFTTRSGLFLTTPDLYVQIPEQTTKDFPHLPEHWNGPRSKSSAWRIRLPTSAAETPGCSPRMRPLCSFSPGFLCSFLWNFPESLYLVLLYFCALSFSVLVNLHFWDFVM